jgi:serine protease Do
MRNVRFVTIAAALTAVVALAAVSLAPAVHGQARSRHATAAWADALHAEAQTWQERGPAIERVIEVLGGRGSEIGVSIRELAEADVKAGRSGVVIEEVRDESPAADAGFKAGDVVTNFDGERVRSTRQFARLVEETPAGRAVKAQVQRDGKPVDLTVTPGVPRHATRVRPGPGGDPPMGGMFRMMPHEEGGPMIFEPGDFDVRVMTRPGRLGVGVQDLTPDLASYFGVKEGVLVTSVNKDSAGAKAGLEAGDVITSVDGKAVEDSADLRRRLWKDEEATGATLEVVRDKKPMSLKVTFEDLRTKHKVAEPKVKRPV